MTGLAQFLTLSTLSVYMCSLNLHESARGMRCIETTRCLWSDGSSCVQNVYPKVTVGAEPTRFAYLRAQLAFRVRARPSCSHAHTATPKARRSVPKAQAAMLTLAIQLNLQPWSLTTAKRHSLGSLLALQFDKLSRLIESRHHLEL